MPPFIHNVSEIIRRVLFLARPYGRAKLAAVFSLSLAQALFQVIGITSIFPFLAIAADPERIRRSHFGTRFLELLPAMENRQLLLVAGIIAIVALLLSNAVNLLSEYARTRYAQNFAHWLRVRLLRRMASQPYTYFLQRNSGDLLKKIMNDVINYAGGVLLPLLDTVARTHRGASTGYAVFGATDNRDFGGCHSGRILCSHVSTSYAQTSGGG